MRNPGSVSVFCCSASDFLIIFFPGICNFCPTTSARRPIYCAATEVITLELPKIKRWCSNITFFSCRLFPELEAESSRVPGTAPGEVPTWNSAGIKFLARKGCRGSQEPWETLQHLWKIGGKKVNQRAATAERGLDLGWKKRKRHLRAEL